MNPKADNIGGSARKNSSKAIVVNKTKQVEVHKLHINKWLNTYKLEHEYN